MASQHKQSSKENAALKVGFQDSAMSPKLRSGWIMHLLADPGSTPYFSIEGVRFWCAVPNVPETSKLIVHRGGRLRR
jgi:hypothetical protein